MKDFKVLKVSYEQTSLDIRESVSFDEASVKKFLVEGKGVLGIDEMLILSTCNRTEIYYVSHSSLKEELCALLDIHQSLNFSSFDLFSEEEGEEAIDHLFRVSIGLESQVLGENQITNQVKKSYQWSADEDMAGPFLHRLLHSIFFTNKRVEQETAFRDGNTSTSSLAVDLVKNFIPKFKLPKILVIGLGDIGRVVVDNMKGIAADVTLVNRTESKAIELADELAFQAGNLNDLDELVNSHHVIITSATTQSYLITEQTLSSTGKIKLFVDLGLPRNVDPQLENRSDILVYNIDQLSQRTNAAQDKRAEIVPDVEAIIEDAKNEFSNWSKEMEVSPTIKKLKEALEEIRKKEIARYVQDVSVEEAARLESVTKSMIQKVIKLPVLQLKAACKRGEAETLIEVLNDLFNLEQEKSYKK